MTTETTHRMSVSDSDEAPSKPLVKRWWFVPAMAAGVLLAMFVLAIVAIILQMWLSHHAAMKEVEAEVARIHSRGEPITAEDFYAWHKVPAGTPDVTQPWLQALASFDEEQLGQAGIKLPFIGEGDAALLDADAPGSQLAAAGQFLKDHERTLQLIHEAAALEGQCRFPIQFENGIATPLPHAQKMRTVQRLLQLEARARLQRGDVDGALESITHMLAAGRSLQHQPTLIEQLVSIACLSMAMSEAEHLLNEAQLSDTQLASLQQSIAVQDFQGGLTSGMIGERGVGYNAFQHIHSLADINALNGNGEGEMNAGGTVGRPADCLMYLQLMGEMVAASREPFPQARDRVALAEQKLKAIAGSSNPLERLKYVVTALMTPATSSAFGATARTLARRDALVTAIAAERFRLKSGSFPARLADLAPDFLPAVPTDPFDGKPLRMLVSGEEFVVYSVSENGMDDQGVDNENSGKPDIVIRMRAVKQAP